MTDQPTRPMREPDEWVPSPRNPEEDALDDARHESRRHTERMRANWDHYIAELATKTTYQCRTHHCFDVITEAGFCVKHNERRWD